MESRQVDMPCPFVPSTHAQPLTHGSARGVCSVIRGRPDTRPSEATARSSLGAAEAVVVRVVYCCMQWGVEEMEVEAVCSIRTLLQ